MVVPESGKKKRVYTSKTNKSNVRAPLLTEFQAAIAYACYDSPALLCGATSMTETQQGTKIADLFFGNSDDNPDFLCYVDQFLHGLNKFHGVYTTSSVEIQPGVSPNTPPAMLLTLLPILHQRGNEVNIFVGKGSIERSLLIGKTVGATVTHVTGRTLLRAAKEVLRSCKKMMAIVTASNSPYKDGNFPSGTNWDDYIRWCIAEMKKVVATEKVGMIASPVVVVATEEAGMIARSPVVDTTMAENSPDAAPELLVVATSTASNNEPGNKEFAGADNADEEPDGKFFKGFIAWCLWGHIPIENDEDMKSMSFTESKVGTSFGRKTGSRSALKAAAALRSDAGIPVDNRRGTKKQKRGLPTNDDNEEATTSYGGADDDTAATSFVCAEDDGILKQALDYLDSESLEKARQKHSMLSCLRVRDEISSLKGQVESASRRFYHAKEGSLHADSLMEKMDALEATLREHEEYLSVLQNQEADRQLKVISERAANRAAAGAAAASVSSHQRSSFAVVEKQDLVREDGSVDNVLTTTPVRQHTVPPSGLVSFASPTKSPAEAMLSIASQEVLVCIECSITPTTHKCRRCRRYVCDLCCYTQRGLEMIWWCAECFDNESLTNQKTIREGNYESDNEII